MLATYERNKVVESVQCPECAKKGRDRHRDNLKVYEDDSTHCFACGYHTFNGTMTSQPRFTPPQTLPMPTTGIKTRGITLQTAERYGVTRLAKTSDSGTVVLDKDANPVGTATLVFPFYSSDTGELVAVKTRDMLQENKKYGIKWEGQTARANYFGTNVNPSATTLIIAEGEIDALTLAQVNPDCAVWGLPGVDWVKKATKQCYQRLKKFKKIIVCLDNDDAGHEATELLLTMLPAGKAHTVALPMDYKDPNEMLMDGDVNRLKQCVKDARQILPKGIVEDVFGTSNSADSFFGDSLGMGISTGFPELDAMSGGLKPGKFLLVAGGTGSGKSTFVENIVYNVALQGKKTFFIPLEMLHQEVSLRLLMQKYRLPFTDPCFDRSQFTRKEIEESFAWIYEHVKFFDHYGGISMDILADTIDYAVDALGCEVVVLDHVTAAATTANGLDWKELESTASRLKQIAIQKGICMLAVTHINRSTPGSEDKMPTLKDIKASGGFAQYADMVLGIARPRDSKKMDVQTLKVERSIGKFGLFTVEFQDCKLVPVTPPPTLDEALDNDATERNQDRQVPLEVRKLDSGSKQTPEPSVRKDNANVEPSETVHPGLPDTEKQQKVTNSLDTTTEGDSVLGYDWRTKRYSAGGGERGFDFSRPNQITRGKEGLSQSRLTSFVSECFTNDKCERKERELRPVGNKKRDKVGGRKRNSQRMVK